MQEANRRRANKMNTTEQRTIKYENPPINEIVCGILFDEIKGLQTGHFGTLWQKFKPDFTATGDHSPINPIPQEDSNNRGAFPLPRVWFVHRDDNEVIQAQRNRFYHNWRRRRPDDKYPGYETVIENFEKYLSSFQEFLAEEKLGNLVPNRYELTYINLISENAGWETLNSLEPIFPNFVSLKDRNKLLADIRGIDWQMTFGLPNDSGQLQLSIRNVRRADDRHLLQIEFTAFSNELYNPMRNWFDSAHEAIIDVFSDMMSDEIQYQFWGRKS